ncbi:MAG: hypothetical protein Q7T61_16075 [Caulobacter sp.]|nr:hypothetical protein [Caulobacter sp.]
MNTTPLYLLACVALCVSPIAACKPPKAEHQDVVPPPEAPKAKRNRAVTEDVYDHDRLKPVASYQRLDGDVSFTLASNGFVWRLEFDVGALEDGAATRSDCYVRVEGKVTRGNRIDGVIVDGQERWVGGAPPSGLREVVVLIPNGARVIEDNIAELCDVDAEGRYRLIDPAKP